MKNFPKLEPIDDPVKTIGASAPTEPPKPIVIELEKIYRQEDQVFIQVLNNVRANLVTNQDIELLNSRCIPNFKPPKETPYIYITTHNKKADAINFV